MTVTAATPDRPAPLRIAVGIATRGRAAILRDTVAELRLQTMPPSRILVCHTEAADVAGLDTAAVELVLAAPGLCRQRNAVLDRLDGCDIVLFLDDDFLPMPDYLAQTAAAFGQRAADLVVTTGTMLADGIKGPGLEVAAGRRILAAQSAQAGHRMTPVRNGYGCNMAIRLSVIRQAGLRFDEALPLYGWLEDVDFCVRAGAHGRMVRLEAARGVHLGVKLGRGSGLRLGYSQVSNPVYLAGRGTLSWWDAVLSLGRNLAANCARSPWPEPYVDRPGRLRGNLLALRDWVLRRMRPMRATDL